MYACPVCEVPQADAEHLANHLAFTALLGDADHEAWLEETVPDWADRDPETLAPAVAEHAEPADDPRVFEDTTGDASRHAPAERAEQSPPDDPELRRVLREARELTERMRKGE